MINTVPASLADNLDALGFGLGVAVIGTFAIAMISPLAKSRTMIVGLYLFLFIAAASFAIHAKRLNFELSERGLLILLAIVGAIAFIAALYALAYIVKTAAHAIVTAKGIEAQTPPRQQILIHPAALSDPRLEDWSRELARGSLPDARAPRQIERRR